MFVGFCSISPLQFTNLSRRFSLNRFFIHCCLHRLFPPLEAFPSLVFHLLRSFHTQIKSKKKKNVIRVFAPICYRLLVHLRPTFPPVSVCIHPFSPFFLTPETLASYIIYLFMKQNYDGRVVKYFFMSGCGSASHANFTSIVIHGRLSSPP